MTFLNDRRRFIPIYDKLDEARTSSLIVSNALIINQRKVYVNRTQIFQLTIYFVRTTNESKQHPITEISYTFFRKKNLKRQKCPVH